MMKFHQHWTKILAVLSITALTYSLITTQAIALPDPALDAGKHNANEAPASVVLAGGCFWGVQAVFQHVKGVKTAVSGYAGGQAQTATYAQVSSGQTGHAEAVEITYDPQQLTLGQLLKVYFSVAHNPTELNRQGPDHGTQYRSAIFYNTAEQKEIIEAYIAQLTNAQTFGAPIVTKIEPLQKFYAAESYHQDYARLHPTNSYILVHDLPKVTNLARLFPDLYVDNNLITAHTLDEQP